MVIPRCLAIAHLVYILKYSVICVIGSKMAKRDLLSGGISIPGDITQITLYIFF